MSKKTKLGAGLIAAAAAGAYFLFGTKEGAKKRVRIKGWMLKARGEVIDKMEDMKEINEEKYKKLVDVTVSKYKKLKKVEKKEADALKADLLKHWKNIKKELKKNDLIPDEIVKKIKKKVSKKK
jgi:hypothetical protein